MLEKLALLLLILAYFALASTHVSQRLRAFYDNRLHGSLLVAMLLIPYILAVLPQARSDPENFLFGLGRMALYLFIPFLAYLFRPARNKPLDGFDLVAIFGVWLPVEFDWLPEADAQLAPGVSLPVPLLTAVCLGFLLFTVIRPLPKFGYTYRLRWQDFRAALLSLAAFSLIGIPLGVWMGFIIPGPVEIELGDWVVRLLAIYFLNALPEELLFRGAIQNLIELRLGRSGKTLVLAAVIFGLAHLNNTTAHHSPPNWPYVIMASLAGVAYGWTWRKTGKITGSAIPHTLVNFIWSVIFVA